MKKYFVIIFIVFTIISSVINSSVAQTIITTDHGIEIFQVEKYYLLKDNVVINSEDFQLSADKVKAYFDKDLYDIVKIESSGNCLLKSQKGIEAKGDKIIFSAKNDSIIVEGTKSFLTNSNIKMYSDQYIEIDNSKGFF